MTSSPTFAPDIDIALDARRAKDSHEASDVLDTGGDAGGDSASAGPASMSADPSAEDALRDALKWADAQRAEQAIGVAEYKEGCPAWKRSKEAMDRWGLLIEAARARLSRPPVAEPSAEDDAISRIDRAITYAGGRDEYVAIRSIDWLTARARLSRPQSETVERMTAALHNIDSTARAWAATHGDAPERSLIQTMVAQGLYGNAAIMPRPQSEGAK